MFQFNFSMERLVTCGMIHAKPAWSVVRESLIKLDSNDLNKSEKAYYEQIVIDYARMLDQSKEILFPALLLISILARYSLVKQSNQYYGRNRALEAIRKWFPRGRRPRRSYTDQLYELLTTLANDIPVTEFNLEELKEIHQYSWDDLSQMEHKLKVPLTPKQEKNQLVSSMMACWEDLVFRLNRTNIRTRPDKDSLAEYLIGETAGITPCVLFERDLKDMTIRQWSRLFLYSLLPSEFKYDLENTNLCPIWVGALALQSLGFSEQVSLSFLSAVEESVVKQDEDWNESVKGRGISTELQPPGVRIKKRLAKLDKESKSDVVFKAKDGRVVIDLILSNDTVQKGLASFVPENDYPCLCLNTEEAEQLSSFLQAISFKILIRNLFVEEPPPNIDPTEYTTPLTNLLYAHSKAISVHMSMPARTRFNDVIPRPEELSELLSRY